MDWGESLEDGPLDAALDDPRCDRVAGEPRGVVEIQLAHQVLPVLLHRLNADAKFSCDLLVRLAFGNQLQHLHLGRRY